MVHNPSSSDDFLVHPEPFTLCIPGSGKPSRHAEQASPTNKMPPREAEQTILAGKPAREAHCTSEAYCCSREASSLIGKSASVWPGILYIIVV